MKKILNISIAIFALVFLLLCQNIYAQIALPWIETFEAIGPTNTFVSDTNFINGSPYWTYERSDTNGRLRFNANSAFNHQGKAAATLDVHQYIAGVVNTNYLIATIPIQAYASSTNLELSFWYTHHGEENHDNDSVWIRGSNTDSWVGVYDLYGNKPSLNTFKNVLGIDIDSALASHNQTITSTFQIRFGQEDNFPSNSDGFTFDDISITGTVPITNNSGFTNFSFSQLCSGVNTVSAELMNSGTGTLSAVNINWSVNGVTQGSTQSWTGVLSSGQTSTINLGTYSFNTSLDYDIKAWTSLPNGVSDSFPLDDTAKVLGFKTKASGVYTINSAIPTGGSNFNSLSEAAFFLYLNGVCGSTVFNIANGVYNEQLTIHDIDGLSAINTLIFKSLSGNKDDVTIQYSAKSSTDNWVVKLSNLKYASIKNVTIKAKGDNYGNVIYLANGCSYISIDSNRIEMPINKSSSNYSGVITDNFSTDSVITISNNEIVGGYCGINLIGDYMTNSKFACVIENNEISDFYYQGAYFSNQDSIQLINNTFKSDKGLSVIYGAYFTNCYKINVRGNKINLYGSGGKRGIYIKDADASMINLSIIANNFISLTGSISGDLWGLYLDNTTYIGVYYNSINIIGDTITSGYTLYQTGGTNQYCKNNILVNIGDGYAYYVNTPNAIVASDHNAYYSTGSNLAFWNGDRTNLLALQTANNKDANSIFVNPQFASPSDLHVNSPAIDTNGIPISYITTDIDGDLRNSTTPDIGADEFSITYYDAGIIQLNEPTFVCPGSVSNIKVQLKNFSVIYLNTCTINWTVNGILQTPYTFTGALSSYSNTIISIGSYTFLSGISYDIKFWTSLPNGQTDENHNNDTTYVYGIQTALSGSFTIGIDATNDYNSFYTAINDLSRRGICGPVIFLVDSGIYNEQITIPEISGASIANTITFKSSTGINTDVVIQYTSSSNIDNWVWKIYMADYVTVEDITIKAVGALYGNVVDLENGAEHNTFKGNIIQSIQPTSSTTGAAVVAITGGKLNQYNTFKDNIIQYGNTGISCIGTSNIEFPKGNCFTNNTITNALWYGSYFERQEDLVFIGNEINVSSNSNNVHGGYFSICYGAQIVNNYANVQSTNKAYGFSILDCDSSSTRRGLVANNMIRTFFGGDYHYCIYSHQSSNYDFYYNTLANYNGNNSSSPIFIYKCSKIKLVNNIFYNFTGGYAASIDSDTNLIFADYNNYHSPNSNYFVNWQGNKSNLISLQTAFPNYNSNSISQNPLFVSKSNSHLTQSSPNNLGTPIPGITNDIDGDIRCSIAPDMGADEWSSHDLFIMELISPLSGACGNASELVKVAIKNSGYYNETNVPIFLSVNTPSGIIALNSVISSISPGTTDTIILGTINTLNSGSYIYTIYHTLSTDVNKTNDTLITMINSYLTVNLGSDTAIHVSNSLNLDAGAGFTSYLWDDNSTNQTRQIVGSVEGAGIHTYYVKVTGSNGCIATDTIVVDITITGINESDNNSSIILFPNPTKGIFQILINGIEGDLNLQIFDASGRMLNSDNLIGVIDGYVKEIDASMLLKGVYYIRLKNNNIIKLEKLVIN